MINDELSIMALLALHGQTDGSRQREKEGYQSRGVSYSPYTIDGLYVSSDTLYELKKRGLIRHIRDYTGELQYVLASDGRYADEPEPEV